MRARTPPRKLVEHARQGRRAKIEIRRLVLEAVTPARAVVFDAFAGQGVMWAEVWRQAAGYVGCDETWFMDDRCCFVADNRRVLRCIDLAPFTVFDLDAFGSPWEQALIIAARRRVQPGERLGLVLTDGSGLRTRFGRLPGTLRQAAGLVQTATIAATSQSHDDLVARALHHVVRQMGGRVVREWLAIGKTMAKVRYYGVVIEAAARPAASDIPGRSVRPARSPAPSDTQPTA